MSKRKEFHVAKALRLRLSDKGDWLASTSRSSGEFFLAAELLPLLQEIQRTHTLDDGLAKRLRRTLEAAATDSPDAQEIAGLVEDFHGAGLLVAKGSKAPKDALLQDGFGDPWIQWAMLSDTPRCRAYEKALRSAVKPKSVVVDVGAGTGLLGAFALNAGAKRVFAIEETASGQRIAPLFKSLGLPSSKPAFELFQGNSQEAPLPADANVIVSELFGNDPFCEGVLPTLRDLGARVPLGVRWIPQSVEVFVEISELRGSGVRERVAALHRARLLKTTDKQDFLNHFLTAATKHLALEEVSFAAHVSVGDVVRQSTPCSLGTVRLDPPSSPVVRFEGKRSLKLTSQKSLENSPLVALVWFRVQLDASTTLSNHPLEKDACGHWSPLILPLYPSKETVFHVRFGLSDAEDHLHVDIRCARGDGLARR